MTEPRYRFCTEPDRFILHRFAGDESLLAFNCASGDTHLLNAFDHLLLSTLQAGGLSQPELIRRLGPQMLDEELPALDGAVEGRLRVLMAHGLIETFE